MFITQFLKDNFGLPAGNLYSNLIASALLGVAGFIWGRAFEKRALDRHRQQLDQKNIHHQKILEEFEKLHDRLREMDTTNA